MCVMDLVSVCLSVCDGPCVCVCLSVMDPVCVCVSVCDGLCVCMCVCMEWALCVCVCACICVSVCDGPCVCVCITIPVCTCLQSTDKAWVSSMVVPAGDACAYVADQRGFVHVYDIEEYGLQGQELQAPTSRHELST